MLRTLYVSGTKFTNAAGREARCLYNAAKDIANNAVDKAAKEVQGLKIARLENKYGEQVGNISPNGNMGFKKQISCDKFLLTGIDKNGNVIAQVTKKDNIVSSFTKKFRKNSKGEVEIHTSQQGTNYRNNIKQNPETGEVEQRLFNIDPYHNYAVTVRKINPFGKQTEQTNNVIIKGKASPLEP